MITIISSTKSIDMQREYVVKQGTEPVFSGEATELVEILKGYSKEELMKLMKISDKLAEVNYDRYMNFHNEYVISKEALFSFSGDVYKSMNPFEYSEEQVEFAQKHLRILSGLYGVLKPLDKIKEYRLEMATKLSNSSNKDLYSYWTEKITNNILGDVNEHERKIILNLASVEYSKTIDRTKLNDVEIFDIEFKENRNGQFKIVGTYAKKARGTMASYIMKNAIDSIEGVKKFKEDGYVFNEELSTEKNLVFTR